MTKTMTISIPESCRECRFHFGECIVCHSVSGPNTPLARICILMPSISPGDDVTEHYQANTKPSSCPLNFSTL